MAQSLLPRPINGRRVKSGSLIFKKAKIQLFKELVNKITWETVLKDKGAGQRWQIFNEAFFKVKELIICKCSKVRKRRQETSMSETGHAGKTEE